MAEILKQVPERQEEDQVGVDYSLRESITLPASGQIPELNEKEPLDHLNGVAYSNPETDLIELDSGQKETPTIPQRILRIINDTQRPMEVRGIFRYLNEDDVGVTEPATIMNLRNIRKHLSAMCGRGEIRRLASDVYSYLEFDGGEDEIPKPIGDRVIECLNATKLPMTIKDVTDYCNESGFAAVDLEVVSVKLSYLCRQRIIKRLDKGLYAYSEFDGELHEISKTPCERTLEVLQDFKQPMPIDKIVDNLNQGNYEELARDTVTDTLKYLCRKEKIKRLVKGVYSCLEFEG